MGRTSAVLIAAVLILTVLAVPRATAAPDDVTVGGAAGKIDGTDIYRGANMLVMYTPAHGTSTGTNAWGFEAAVVDGKIVQAEHLVGDMAIPAGGYVLSGHGDARKWLNSVAVVGADVVLGQEPPPPPPPPVDADAITVDGEPHPLDGTNTYRAKDYMVRYTPSHGATTGTNGWGFEAVVVAGKVVEVESLVGDIAIPEDGYVLSGHGNARIWLQINAKVGSVVNLGDAGPPPPPDPGEPPAPNEEQRWLEGDANCTEFYVPVTHQKRTSTWEWNGTEWVETWGDWMTHHTENRGATAEDCPVLDDALPAGIALPDIRIKNLDKCGKGDLDLTGGDCFMIVNPGPYVSDFPHLEGRKLLKFPVITLNVGDGRAEVIANRTSHYVDDWVTYQRYYTATGELAATREVTNVDYYFAGDGHDHWHFTDFDDYRIETLDGKPVGTADFAGPSLRGCRGNLDGDRYGHRDHNPDRTSGRGAGGGKHCRPCQARR
jgi:hypothetical protein